jgi:hypothetical protein
MVARRLGAERVLWPDCAVAGVSRHCCGNLGCRQMGRRQHRTAASHSMDVEEGVDDGDCVNLENADADADEEKEGKEEEDEDENEDIIDHDAGSSFSKPRNRSAAEGGRQRPRLRSRLSMCATSCATERAYHWSSHQRLRAARAAWPPCTSGDDCRTKP